MQVASDSPSTFDLEAYSCQRRQLIEERLDEYLSERKPEKLWQAMRYSVLAGGKRLRALLAMAAAEAVYLTNTASRGVGSESAVWPTVVPLCCAIEMVHAMSLVHDDLPAMDNDDFRRGKPTNHKVFGEAVAILAGDALFIMANEILVTKTPPTVDREALIKVVAELAQAVGPEGMVAGQIYDLAFTGAAEKIEKKEIYPEDIAMIETIHKYKTAAFIAFSARAGARLAGASASQLAWFGQFAEILGLAFQVADDLLDCTGNMKDLGKTPGKDQAANKATWVTCFGMEAARAKLSELEDAGLTLLDNSDLEPSSRPVLQALLQYAIHRKS
jgi:geranylgeranyl diphosphate synthase type II